MRKNNLKLLILLLLLGSVSLSGSVAFAQVTQAQVQGFMKMPESQQKAIIGAMKGRSNSGQIKSFLSDNEGGGGDKGDNGGQGEVSLPNPETQLQKDITPKITPPSDADPLVSGDTILLRMTANDGEDSRIPESIIYTLDRTGSISLPSLGPIVISGLNIAQAEELISIEPALKGLTISIKRMPINGGLAPFGYDVFLESDQSFNSITALPAPDNYVVGPGDTVIIQLFGKENSEYELDVKRNGALSFPGIGPIQVAGIDFISLKKEIKSRVKRQFIGTQVSVTLGRLRSIRVFVLGEVMQAGSYTVSGLSTLTNALFASGGVKGIGSLRNIQLKRNGKVISNFDLYDLLLHGNTQSDKRLLPGDVIFVPPIGKTVGISGEILRPAIYELKNEKSINDLVKMAGGFSPEALLDNIQIKRIKKSGGRSLQTVDLTSSENGLVGLMDGDIVTILSQPDKLEKFVSLQGYVESPGDYSWFEGMRIRDLIPSFNMLLPGADKYYLVIKRQFQDKRGVELLDVNLMKVLSAHSDEENIPLNSKDEVYIFDSRNARTTVLEPWFNLISSQTSPGNPLKIVNIKGLLHHPDRYPLTENMKVSDLLRAAGGLTDNAYTLRAELTSYVVSEGERRELLRRDINLDRALAGDQSFDVQLKPYDELLVRRIPSWDEEGHIELLGEVEFPGTYSIGRGERLSDVIKRAGGLTDMGYAKGAVFVRESVRERESKHLKRMAMQLERDLAVVQAHGDEIGLDKGQTILEGKVLLEQVRSVEAMGRMVINLPTILEESGSYDVALQSSDLLYIPKRPDEVTVVGEVYHLTSHIYEQGVKRDEYVRLSGGITERGNKKAVYVVHANGSVSPPNKWYQKPVEIGPGDTIIVPVKVDRISKLKLFTDVSQIIYQLAVSAASLKVFNLL